MCVCECSWVLPSWTAAFWEVNPGLMVPCVGYMVGTLPVLEKVACHRLSVFVSMWPVSSLWPFSPSCGWDDVMGRRKGWLGPGGSPAHITRPGRLGGGRGAPSSPGVNRLVRDDFSPSGNLCIKEVPSWKHSQWWKVLLVTCGHGWGAGVRHWDDLSPSRGSRALKTLSFHTSAPRGLQPSVQEPPNFSPPGRAPSLADSQPRLSPGLPMGLGYKPPWKASSSPGSPPGCSNDELAGSQETWEWSDPVPLSDSYTPGFRKPTFSWAGCLVPRPVLHKSPTGAHRTRQSCQRRCDPHSSPFHCAYPVSIRSIPTLLASGVPSFWRRPLSKKDREVYVGGRRQYSERSQPWGTHHPPGFPGDEARESCG